MKKLLIAILLAWSIVYFLDNAWFSNVHMHLDFDDHHMNMVEWLVGGLVLAVVFIVLAAMIATGIFALFVASAAVALVALVFAGFSAVWPIFIGVAIYLACRESPRRRSP